MAVANAVELAKRTGGTERHCVYRSAVLVHLLSAMGIKADVLPCRAFAVHDKIGIYWLCSDEEWVAANGGTDVINAVSGDYPYHMIVRTEDFCIDSSCAQFNQMGKGSFPDGLAFEAPADATARVSVRVDNCRLVYHPLDNLDHESLECWGVAGELCDYQALAKRIREEADAADQA